MFKIFRLVSFVFLVAATLTFSASVSAHIGAASVEQIIDGRLVDIGYSPETPRANEQSRLDFAILEPDTLKEQSFSDVWVRIKDDRDRLLFAGGLSKAEFGLTGMTYVFPEPGDYQVFVRFSQDGETIVEATATITIYEAVSGSWSPLGMSEAVSFLVGAIIAFGSALLLFRLRPMPRSGKKGIEVVLEAEDKRRSSWTSRIPYAPIIIGLVCSILAFYATRVVLSTDLAFDTKPKSEIPVREGEVSVVLTNSGFNPPKIAIKKGSTVTFSTDTDRPFWPASNLHPDHDEYPDFDPKEPIPPDETWSFTFDQVGSWGMHDHLRSYFSGQIEVRE